VALRRSNVLLLGVGAALAAFVAVGLVGAHRYLGNYLAYRGFSAPQEPGYVTSPGTLQKIAVPSPALGGHSQEVYVYLPSGYAQQPQRRYPVLYLLHGFPGRPLALVDTVRMGIIDDSLTALRRAQPMILVMPFGSTGTFTDKEWVNGATRGNDWSTFVARDVVRYVDSHYRTIPLRGARAIGGLSEGGYGAIDIALHHPREFSVVESWSGYEKPDPLRPIFGSHLQLLARNDPRSLVQQLAPTLRRLHTYFWFYSSSEDRLHTQNGQFAQELRQLRLPHAYFEDYGGHNWALWRKNAPQAYLVAARRLRA
jgi:enterochelin esterase-like enzyme